MRRSTKVVAVVALAILMALCVSVTGGAQEAVARVTMNLKGADIRDVLRTLAELGGVNLIADSSVKGDVTLSLKDVNVSQAIEMVTMVAGYEMRKVGDVMLIATSARFEKGFDKAETHVYRLFYADPDTVKSALTIIVPSDQVKSDKRTNSVVVSGIKMQLDAVESVIAGLDIELPLIHIEARLEEIAADATRNAGIDWTFGPIKLVQTPGGALVGATLTYGAVLKALEDKGDAVTLARPDASTLDGMEANIFIGERIPIVTERTTDDKIVTQVTYIEAGVKLSITPKVNRNGLITVHVKPEVSSITDTTTEGFRHIRSRQAEIWATVRDGETIAIAGLFQKEELEKIYKVPILGDIPLIGELFKRRTLDQKDTEMVIFITPRIVRHGQLLPVYTSMDELARESGETVVTPVPVPAHLIQLDTRTKQEPAPVTP